MAKEDSKTVSEAPKKGKVTPKRKVQEQKNSRPIVKPNVKAPKVKLSKEEKAELRTERRAETNASMQKEQAAMRGGDPKYLPLRDRGPIKKFLRNKVDEKRTIVEFFLLVAIVLLLGTTALTESRPEIAVYLTMATYAYLLVSIVVVIFKVRSVKNTAIAEFGAEKIKAESGVTSYIVMRMTQPRFLRLPKVGV